MTPSTLGNPLSAGADGAAYVSLPIWSRDPAPALFNFCRFSSEDNGANRNDANYWRKCRSKMGKWRNTRENCMLMSCMISVFHEIILDLTKSVMGFMCDTDNRLYCKGCLRGKPGCSSSSSW